jgi:hypothetical protein
LLKGSFVRIIKPNLAIPALLASLIAPGALWARDPWVGTWKLNQAKWKSASPLARCSIVKLEPRRRGIKSTEHVVGADGEAYRLAWTARFDAKDYPVAGSRVGIELVSARRIDANTLDMIASASLGVGLTCRQTEPNISRTGGSVP